MVKMTIYPTNVWCGNTEYVCVFCNGTHEVRMYEYPGIDYPPEVVFTGHYEECLAYMEGRRLEYLESCIG